MVPTNSAASMLMAGSGGSIVLLSVVGKNRVHVHKLSQFINKFNISAQFILTKNTDQIRGVHC